MLSELLFQTASSTLTANSHLLKRTASLTWCDSISCNIQSDGHQEQGYSWFHLIITLLLVITTRMHNIECHASIDCFFGWALQFGLKNWLLFSFVSWKEGVYTASECLKEFIFSTIAWLNFRSQRLTYILSKIRFKCTSRITM